jgi:hypothetical protein
LSFSKLPRLANFHLTQYGPQPPKVIWALFTPLLSQSNPVSHLNSLLDFSHKYLIPTTACVLLFNPFQIDLRVPQDSCHFLGTGNRENDLLFNKELNSNLTSRCGSPSSSQGWSYLQSLLPGHYELTRFRCLGERPRKFSLAASGLDVLGCALQGAFCQNLRSTYEAPWSWSPIPALL